MIELIYLLAEILSVVICIFNICSKKIRISINLLILISVDVLYITLINTGFFEKKSLPVIYVIIVFFSLLEFENRLSHTICICSTAFIFVTALQMIMFFPANLLSYIFSEDVVVLVINLINCVLLALTRKFSIYIKLYHLCKLKELKIFLCVGIVLLFTGYYLYLIKVDHKVQMDAYITCLVLIIMTMYLVLRWQKSHSEILVKDEQIEVARKCKNSFEELINIARKNQHDLNNHIIAITGMHNVINTYDELVTEQKKYIGEISNRSKINRILLGVNEPILAGYLFNKLSQIRKNGIEIEYNLCVFSNSINYISIFDLNEIVGILLDNATEAIISGCEENKKIYLDIDETESWLEICVANPSEYLKEEQILEIFKAGKSTKGQNRGLGLSKIKDYEKHYGFDILVENKKVNTRNWIYFTIKLSTRISSGK
ncbi:MAG: GHKL domain-containing protein [Eubacterium sp.]|nr:GHKL domain-containing protein [Eubacterium sp.]